MNKISLDEKITVENDLVTAADKNELSVEDEYMIDCLNQLDDHETDIKKIADASHQFLLANAIKNAKQILKECHFKCHFKLITLPFFFILEVLYQTWNLLLMKLMLKTINILMDLAMRALRLIIFLQMMKKQWQKTMKVSIRVLIMGKNFISLRIKLKTL